MAEDFKKETAATLFQTKKGKEERTKTRRRRQRRALLSSYSFDETKREYSNYNKERLETLTLAICLSTAAFASTPSIGFFAWPFSSPSTAHPAT